MIIVGDSSLRTEWHFIFGPCLLGSCPLPKTCWGRLRHAGTRGDSGRQIIKEKAIKTWQKKCFLGSTILTWPSLIF